MTDYHASPSAPAADPAGTTMATGDAERAYNARAAVPDHPAIFARWAAEAAAARADFTRSGRFRPAIVYGRRGDQVLDLVMPETGPGAGGGVPVLVFFHGGYWQAMSRESFTQLARGYVARGVAVALVDYTLAPATTVAGIVEEAREAVALLWRLAPALGLDRRRIVVAGHSAGGQIVGMLAATDWAARDPALAVAAPLIAGGVAISGVFDLEPLIATSINAKLGLDVAGARAASPHRLAPQPCTRLVLAVGGDESSEFHRQSRDFGRRWQAAGARIDMIDLPGRHHMSAVEALGEDDHPLMRATLRLLGTDD
ncbi:esterase [Tistrella bauzanensis]|uniref:Esterase n=1 Tax=Tistrella bauzanensis TaxID=657419 RepID=A0ABQ1IN09_9PROT|nr:alpha/beta hydrolase [Tistrella bauzanensis]GGB47890.1 esterase [Tistrella bauzanensis]